jgi:hypothetical protein
MQKRSRKKHDVNQIAYSMVEAIALGIVPAMLQTPGGKNPFAVALGRRGGLKGGPARAASMTAEERSNSAKKAAVARWTKSAK